MNRTVVRTVCPHDCPDQCSMLITVVDGQIERVQGDPNHPFTRGFLCTKGARYRERVYSPERVLFPLRRIGQKGEGRFAQISWDAALDEICDRWQSIRAKHGDEALLGYAYSGNMGLVNRHIVAALFHALGATRLLAGTVCDTAANVGWQYSLGTFPGTDPEEVVYSDLVICWGTDLVTTNLHLVPLIEQARSRGARVVAIDPVATKTVRWADNHIQPRVGTDTALALALMHVLVRDDRLDHRYIYTQTAGFDRLCTEVLPKYAPARAERITGVPADHIEWLARLYGEARRPFIRLGQGLSRHSGGGMAIRTIACLPALTGAWKHLGGGLFMESTLVPGPNLDAVRRPDLLPQPTRMVNHAQLGCALLELTDPPIHGLFIAGNNPAVTCPDSGKMRAGLSREDLFTVVHDTFMTDTARYADMLLPACSSFESEDLYRSYGTYYVQLAQQVIEPLGESQTNLCVVQRLAQRLGLSDPLFRQQSAELIQRLFAGLNPLGTEYLVKLAPARRESAITHFFTETMAAANLPPLPGWMPDPLEPPPAAGFPLRLLTTPGHFQHHTAFAGVSSLREMEGLPCCLLHPADAAVRGVGTLDPVLISNQSGAIGLYAKVTTDTSQSVVVVQGQSPTADYLCGGPINILTSSHLSDLGEGATYTSTWVEVRRLVKEEQNGSRRSISGGREPA